MPNELTPYEELEKEMRAALMQCMDKLVKFQDDQETMLKYTDVSSKAIEKLRGEVEDLQATTTRLDNSVNAIAANLRILRQQLQRLQQVVNKK